MFRLFLFLFFIDKRKINEKKFAESFFISKVTLHLHY